MLDWLENSVGDKVIRLSVIYSNTDVHEYYIYVKKNK